MKKLNLSIQAVEDRTAPVMFTERNLPGFCCCSCCCSCCWGGGGSSTNTLQPEELQQQAVTESLSFSEIADLKGISVAELNSLVEQSTISEMKTIDWNDIDWGDIKLIELP